MLLFYIFQVPSDMNIFKPTGNEASIFLLILESLSEDEVKDSLT